MVIVERVKAHARREGSRASASARSPAGCSSVDCAFPAMRENSRQFVVDAVSPGYFEALGVRLAGRPVLRGARRREDGQRRHPGEPVRRPSVLERRRSDRQRAAPRLINDRHRACTSSASSPIFAGRRSRQEPGPTIYQLSNQSRNFLAGSMLHQGRRRSQALVPAIRDVIRSIDRELPFSGVDAAAGAHRPGDGAAALRAAPDRAVLRPWPGPRRRRRLRRAGGVRRPAGAGDRCPDGVRRDGSRRAAL